MLNNTPTLKDLIDDLLSAGLLVGVCTLIILYPEPSSRRTEIDASSATMKHSATRPTTIYDTSAKPIAAPKPATFVKAQ